MNCVRNLLFRTPDFEELHSWDWTITWLVGNTIEENVRLRCLSQLHSRNPRHRNGAPSSLHHIFHHPPSTTNDERCQHSSQPTFSFFKLWLLNSLRSDVPHRFHPNSQPSRGPHEISNEQNIEFYRIVQNHHSSVVVKLPAALIRAYHLQFCIFFSHKNFRWAKWCTFFVANNRLSLVVVSGAFFVVCLFLNSFFDPHCCTVFCLGISE